MVGERVLLRRPMVQDLEEFITLNRASTRLHRSLVSSPTRPEEFHDFLTRCGRDDCECFLICRTEDGAVVGTINFESNIALP